MKKGKLHLVRLLRIINGISGIASLFSLPVMLVTIYLGHRSSLYYTSAGAFVGFGLLFAATAAVFMLRSVVWHVETKRLRYLVRHYLYALVIVFLVLLLLDHITMGDDFGWDRIFCYSFVIALGSVYLSGYRLRIGARPPKRSAEVG